MRFRLSYCCLLLSLCLTPNLNAQLPAGTLDRIKKATVLVRVDVGRSKVTGSGFLIRRTGKTGYVMTNAHVIARGKREKREVTVTFNSGGASANTVPAQVVGWSSEHDLAVLKIESDSLPLPIKQRAKTPVETTPAFVVGFPFGEKLSIQEDNPSVTISKGTVTSIRRDESNRVILIQLDGDINPGNSGGPVVDKSGALIGVAVAKVSLTQIGFAVPTAWIDDVMVGYLDQYQINQAERKKRNAELTVEVKLNDPLSNLSDVQVHLIPASQIAPDPKPKVDGTWAALPADAQASSLLERFSDPLGNIPHLRGAVKLRSETAANEEIYAYQFSYRRNHGTRQYGAIEFIRVVFERESVASIDEGGWLKPSGPKPNKTAPPETRPGAVTEAAALPKPTSPNLTLPVTRKKVKNATITVCNLENLRILPRAFWNGAHSRDRLLTVTSNGLVRRITVPGFRVETQIAFKRGCYWFGRCSEGWLVYLDYPREMVVLDARTLEPTQRFEIGRSGKFSAASPQLPYLFTIQDQHNVTMSVFDVTNGQVIRKYTVADLLGPRHKSSRFIDFDVSADGKYFCLVSSATPRDRFDRFKIVGHNLVHDEQLVGESASRRFWLDDSRYVFGLPANPSVPLSLRRNEPGIYVHQLEDLSFPIGLLGPVERVLGITTSPLSRQVFVIARDHARNIHELVAFDPRGDRLTSYDPCGLDSSHGMQLLPYQSSSVLAVSQSHLTIASIPSPSGSYQPSEKNWLGAAEWKELRRQRGDGGGALVVNESRAGRRISDGPFTLTQLKDLTAQLHWSRDGQTIYAMDGGHTVRKLRADTLIEERSHTLDDRPRRLCGVGDAVIVISRHAPFQMHVLDPTTLEVRFTRDVGHSAYVPYGPYIIGHNGKDEKIVLIDIQSGETLREFSLPDVQRQRPPGRGLEEPDEPLRGKPEGLYMTMDNRFLLMRLSGYLHRFTLNGTNMVYDGRGPRHVRELALSADSRYAALKQTASTWKVFDLADLSTPLPLNTKDCVAVQFDTANKCLYLLEGGKLKICEPSGRPRHVLDPLHRDHRFFELLVSPKGGDALLRTSDGWYKVTVAESERARSGDRVSDYQRAHFSKRTAKVRLASWQPHSQEQRPQPDHTPFDIVPPWSQSHDGLRVTPVGRGQNDTSIRPRTILWSSSGDSVLLLDERRSRSNPSCTVRRVRIPEFTQTAELKVPQGFSAFARCRGGVLLATNHDRIWLIDEQSLRVKREFDFSGRAATYLKLAAAPGSDFAFVQLRGQGNEHTIIRLNLVTGAKKDIDLYKMIIENPLLHDRYFVSKNHQMQDLLLSPDGRYLVFLNNTRAHRFALASGEPRYEESVAVQHLQGMKPRISEDSRYLLYVPKPGDVAADRPVVKPGDVDVYSLSDFVTPVLTFNTGSFRPAQLAFNVAQRTLIAVNRSLVLNVYSSSGSLLSRHDSRPRNSREFSVLDVCLDPQGKRMFIVGGNYANLIEFEKQVTQAPPVGPGWLGLASEHRLLGSTLGKPHHTGRSLLASTDGQENTVTGTLLQSPNLLPTVVWSEDGANCFVLSRDGLLRRIRATDFVEEIRLNVGHVCASLSPSAQGLVLSLPELEQVWVVDATTLEVKRKIGTSAVRQALSVHSSSKAYVIAGQKRDQLLEIDLKHGLKTNVWSIGEIHQPRRKRMTTFSRPVLSPAMDYLICNGWQVRLGSELTIAEVTGEYPQVSSDHQYVAVTRRQADHLPSESAGAHKWCYVYGVSNMERPLLRLQDVRPGAFAIDVHGRWIHAVNQAGELVTFAADGELVHRMPLGITNSHGSVTRVFSQPAGNLTVVVHQHKSAPTKFAIVSVPSDPNPAKGGLWTESALTYAASPSELSGVPAGSVGSAMASNIPVSAPDTLASMQWGPKGKSLFALEKTGILRRFSVPDFKETTQQSLGYHTEQLVGSKAGLVILLSGRGEVWTVDRKTLEVIHRISVPGVQAIAGAAKSNVVVALCSKGGDKTWHMLDAKAGMSLAIYDDRTVREAVTGESYERRNAKGVINRPNMTANGKHLIWAAEDRVFRVELSRRGEIKGGAFSSKIGSEQEQLVLSPDSRYVVSSSDDVSNGQVRGYLSWYGRSSLIYMIDDLRNPLIGFGRSFVPMAVDPQSRSLFGLSYEMNRGLRSNPRLAVMNAEGDMRERLELWNEQDQPRQLLPHPDGMGLVVLSEYRCVWLAWSALVNGSKPRQSKEWIGSEDDRARLAAIRSHRPYATNVIFESKEVSQDGLEGIAIRLPGDELLGPHFLSDTGDEVYALDQYGVIRTVQLSSSRELMRLDTGKRCNELAMSNAGLVVLIPDEALLWVLDPKTLRRKKKIGLSNLEFRDRRSFWLATSPSEHRCFVATQDWAVIVDLKQAKVTEHVDFDQIEQQQRRRARLHADAKPMRGPRSLQGRSVMGFKNRLLFVINNDNLRKFQLADSGLIYEEARPLSSMTGALVISNDDRYIAVPCRRDSNKQTKVFESNATPIYSVENMQSPVLELHSPSPLTSLTFDSHQKKIYAFSFASNLLVFGPDGHPIKEFDLNVGLNPRYLSVHPEGGGVVFRTRSHLVSARIAE